MINRQPRHKRTGADAVRKRGKQTEQKMMNLNPSHPHTHAHTLFQCTADQSTCWIKTTLYHTEQSPSYWTQPFNTLNTSSTSLYNIWRMIQMQIKMNTNLFAYSLDSLKGIWTCGLNKQFWRTGGNKISVQNWIAIQYTPFFKLLLLLPSELVVFACKRRHTVTEHSQSKF